MAKETIVVKVTTGEHAGKEASFTYDIPTTLREAIDNFGEDVCEAHCIRSLVVAIQGHARGMVGKKTDAEIQAAMDDWRPGMPRQSKSAEEKFDELWEKMSPEDRAAIQKRMRASKAAA